MAGSGEWGAHIMDITSLASCVRRACGKTSCAVACGDSFRGRFVARGRARKSFCLS